jgi:hypothetical protein
MPIIPFPPGPTGRGLLIVNDLLTDVSYALVEKPVNTILNTSIIIAGVNTITPLSMVGIYPGCELIIRSSVLDPPNQPDEAVIVSSTTAGSFTAFFLYTHVATDAVQGATFPSGQIDHPLFTQSEMLKYVIDVQNDFLLKVKPLYVVGNVNLLTNQPTYAVPVDSVQIERIAIEGRELDNVAQSDVDWVDPAWMQLTTLPNAWYQDNLDFETFGVSPPPSTNLLAELFYSQKLPMETTVTLLSPLLVPDVMVWILKYGILARAWSKDGEQRDLARAAATQQIYDMFVLVSQKFLMGVAARMNRSDETVEPVISAMKK